MPSASNLGIEDVVAQRRALRNASLQSRHRSDRPPRLPSRVTLTEIVAGLSASMFPNRLGRPDLTREGIDHYVGHTLDVALRSLNEQLGRELLFASNLDALSEQDAARAWSITSSSVGVAGA